MMFVAQDFASHVTFLGESEVHERAWAMLHTDQGPFAMAVWYRPPAPGHTSCIDTFEDEWRRHAEGSLGTIVMGDLNVHHREWLRFSTHNSVEGARLQAVCYSLSLRQIVSEPTREGNLLDLALTDIESTRCRVLPKIADHSIVEMVLELAVPQHAPVEREVWDFRKADWERLSDTLQSCEWSDIMGDNVDEAAQAMTNTILSASTACIPKRLLKERKSTHPWLNDRVVELVKAKAAAAGTEEEKTASESCSAAIMEERSVFIQRIRMEMAELPRGSKQWWTKSRELLQMKGRCCSIPALKHEHGWVKEAGLKAQVFAKTFAGKNVLATKVLGTFSELQQCPHHQLEPVVPSERRAFEILKNLREDSATGPDILPTKILRKVAAELAKPFVALASLIVAESRWPSLWLVHWMVPLWKKKSVYDALNYRGIHLTAQLSKAMERFLEPMFSPHIERTLAFGPNQFAYTRRRGARDALAVMVLTWLRGFNEGMKFGTYCSDVSGAFDRVRVERLLDKLRAKGFHEKIVNLFASWLRPRSAHVVVGGARSDAMELTNMVYQGTVWGPTLWNLFYEDARLAIELVEFTAMVYADDLNAYKSFKLKAPSEEVLAECQANQRHLHKRGGANEVAFDPGKGSMHIVSHSQPAGGNFKILGVDYDCRLVMADAVHAVVHEVVWKIRTLLRSRRYHTQAEMVDLYKSRVVSFIEYRTAAIYHASDSVLKPLDEVQQRFLRDVGVTNEEALAIFNLGPLPVRRDMAMLGMIHRTVLGRGPPQLEQFFLHDLAAPARATRVTRRHHHHLREWVDGRQLEVVKRSALGSVSVYNLLPQAIVDASSVPIFQSKLQSLLKHLAATQVPEWERLFSPRLPFHSHILRHCS